MQNVGKNIKKYREVAGLTQKELANKSGVTYSTITKIEAGIIKNPTISQVSKISSYLDIRMDDLVFNENTVTEDITKGKFIDLFAGIGGFRLALESFGLECIFSSEWDKQAQKTYEANFDEKPFGDITKINEKKIPKHNILCAGFPCQAFSISGKQLGFQDTRGTLFFDIARIAKFHKPEILFLENVKNLVRHNNGKTLETIRNVLKQIGYDVFYKVLNASDYGIPTSRERIYFICFRKDLKVTEFRFPESNGKYVKLEDYLEEDKAEIEKSIIRRDDIHIRNKIIEPDLLGNYPQKPIRVGTINKGGQGERIYSPLGHAITLSAYGGGAGSKTGAYLIDGKVRKLTPRECANVMGFPKDFVIPVNKTQAYKQFGNSVAVPILKEIFKNIIKAYNEKTRSY
ncbi:DNA (cytosine-5-)-methyltransferase [Candidatus Dojkabacteria bacterium]|nr:DNA (cytosine-5-)-methyltransferase [Candidatus Dojkabacteria bacterium]